MAKNLFIWVTLTRVLYFSHQMVQLVTAQRPNSRPFLWDLLQVIAAPPEAQIVSTPYPPGKNRVLCSAAASTDVDPAQHRRNVTLSGRKPERNVGEKRVQPGLDVTVSPWAGSWGDTRRPPQPTHRYSRGKKHAEGGCGAVRVTISGHFPDKPVIIWRCLIGSKTWRSQPAPCTLVEAQKGLHLASAGVTTGRLFVAVTLATVKCS